MLFELSQKSKSTSHIYLSARLIDVKSSEILSITMQVDDIEDHSLYWYYFKEAAIELLYGINIYEKYGNK